ncbi:hypothetical protein [Kitasatospora sp. NPDC002040]|uniref:hypothetical protein n=1 Tax=Kitasatospora sp. NPDC002040 TaxID=3154661 RepID=UPI003325E353
MFRHSEKLRRLADRDGVTVHSATPLGPPERWSVRLALPPAPPTAPWAFQAPGEEPPQVGDVLEQWLGIASGQHPPLAAPEAEQAALRAELVLLLGDRLPEYHRAAGLG